MRQEEITKYEFIDALRGFAILPVIFIHTSLFYVPTLPILSLIAAKSAHGVQLFYIASALTLFLSMSERSKTAEFDQRGFFIRRFFRIAPLFYVAIAVYSWFYFSDAVNQIHDGVQRWQLMWAPAGIQWWYVPLTALFLNGWLPSTINSVIPVGWSIAVEMTFYLFVPLLYRKIRDINSAILFTVISVILLKVLVLLLRPVAASYFPLKWEYLYDGFFYFWFFGQLPVFGLGIITFHIYKAKGSQPDWKLGYILIFAAFFLFISFLKTETFMNIIPAQMCYGLAFMIFALGLAYAPLKIFVNPVMSWIGKVSFSLYLVHLIVFEYLVRYLPSGIPGVGKNTNLFIMFIIATMISCGVSFFTYKFIELPGMNLGKSIISRMRSSQAGV
jgi:peptidoglycan/LPS O-acetylase OafA/YrhL